MKTASACRLTSLWLFVALTLCPAAAQEKKAAPPPKAEGYAASVPKPTLAGVRYGDHERHVLDFWRAESDHPLGSLALSTAPWYARRAAPASPFSS